MDVQPIRILLQTTIPPTEDDWSIARFSRLAALLSAQRDDQDRPLYDVMTKRGCLDSQACTSRWLCVA